MSKKQLPNLRKRRVSFLMRSKSQIKSYDIVEEINTEKELSDDINKPIDNKLVDNKPVDNKPVDNKPIDNKPVDNKPIDNNFNFEQILNEIGIYNKLKHTRKRLTISHIEDIIESQTDFYTSIYQKIVFGRKSELLEEFSFYTIRMEDEVQELIGDINDNPSADLQKYLRSKQFSKNIILLKRKLAYQSELELRNIKLIKYQDMKIELETKKDEFPLEINSIKNKYKNISEKLNKLKEENLKKKEHLIYLNNNKLKENKNTFEYFNEIMPGITNLIKILNKFQFDFQDSNKKEIKEYLELLNKYLKTPTMDFENLIYDEELIIKRKKERNKLQKEESKNLEKNLNFLLIKNNELKKNIKEIKEIVKLNENDSWTNFLDLKERLELTEKFMKLEIEKGFPDKLYLKFNYFKIIHCFDHKIEVSLINKSELNINELIICKYLIKQISRNLKFENLWYLIKAYCLCLEINYLNNKNYQILIEEENNQLKIFIKDKIFYLKDGDLFFNDTKLFFFGGICSEIKE